jgi:hypothetical protein
MEKRDVQMEDLAWVEADRTRAREESENAAFDWIEPEWLIPSAKERR